MAGFAGQATTPAITATLAGSTIGWGRNLVIKSKAARPTKPKLERNYGSKSLRRALGLLRLVAAHDLDGARLTKLANEAELPVPTAHRLLMTLEKEQMVAFDSETKRYNLGMGFVMLNESSRTLALKAAFRPALERMSEAIEENVYLVMPIGYDGLLLDRTESTLPERISAPPLGGRRPLGVGASALALLAAYGVERAKAIFEANMPRYEGYDWIDADAIARGMRSAWKRGYAVIEGQTFREMTGIGMAYCDKAGEPVAAVGILALNSRLPLARRSRVAEIMRAELAKVVLPNAPSRAQGLPSKRT